MENASEPPTNPMAQGCGPNHQINIHVSPTTGGDFYLSIEADSTVENLKKIVSKRLKVPKDRICLLFRDKQLQEGSLVQYGIGEGSRITLLPNVETGLINQRPEVGIMQALESLNDSQVSEFLCGKAPLNLSMRLGDHMMLIQLQLSTVSQHASASAPASGTQAAAGTSKPSASGARQAPAPLVQTPAPPSLLQASKNLQHTLRRLSADIFAAGRDRNGLRDPRFPSSGRRENVYSGTFSGALSPTLQDSRGRPRRDVATIVHILNDLLCSVPELRRSGARREGAPSPPPAEDVRPEEAPAEEARPPADDQALVTRSKLDHLRLVMGERRERRRQRKQKPYSLPQANDDTVTA